MTMNPTIAWLWKNDIDFAREWLRYSRKNRAALNVDRPVPSTGRRETIANQPVTWPVVSGLAGNNGAGWESGPVAKNVEVRGGPFGGGHTALAAGALAEQRPVSFCARAENRWYHYSLDAAEPLGPRAVYVFAGGCAGVRHPSGGPNLLREPGMAR